MSFGGDFEAFEKKYEVTADELLQGTLLEMGNSLIDMSPVGDPDSWKNNPPPGYVGGRYRGNWQHSAGQPAQTTLFNIDPTGAKAKAQLEGELQSIKAGGINYITNNLPYGPALENGWSRQAPAGMVRVTVARFQDILGDTLRALV